jgi:low temperature requirement protein LtrA
MRERIRHPLRLRANSGEERHATWLELFFDLFFVITVAELGHNLGGDVSLRGVIGFAALFVPVWWAWVGEVFYDTRFDSDDVPQRVITFAQLGMVAVLAVMIHDGLGETSTGFALAYAGVRVLLVVQYIRAGRSVPEARPLTRRFGRGFAIAAVIWVVSVFVPPPWRWAVWALAVAIDFGTPIFAGQLHAKIAPDRAHLPERFGLFVIIVLGEAVLGVVNGMSEQQWTWTTVIVALLGLTLVFSVWWLYFDHVDGAAIAAAQEAGRIGVYQTWLYGHLPLVISIVAAGVGMEHVLVDLPDGALPTADRWLLCGAVALCWGSLAIVHAATSAAGSRRCFWSQARTRALAAIFVLLLAAVGGALPPLVLVGVIAAAGALQVVVDVRGRRPEPSAESPTVVVT